MIKASLPITGIIFSRDRALQLDATLRSFLLHCQDNQRSDLHVIFQTSDGLHEKQYRQLIQEYGNYRNICFHPETRFRRDVLRWATEGAGLGWGIYPYLLTVRLGMRFVWLSQPLLKSSLSRNNSPARYLFFLVDDNIFTTDFYLEEIIGILEARPQALGFSLRLGKNTTACYMGKRSQYLPAFTLIDSQNQTRILEFDWRQGDGDFGYPLEVSSSIYRTADLLLFLNQNWFSSPNTLEGLLANNRSVFLARPRLLCYEKSVTFCNPVNIVQQEFPSLGGITHAYSSEFLAEQFLAGRRVDVEAYSGFIPNSCHQEVEIHFLKKLNG